MQPLRSVLAALADRPDVTAAMVVSDDGLVVEASLPAGLDPDELAALATSAGRAIAALGAASQFGDPVQTVVDCTLGVLVLQRLPSRATLLVLADGAAEIGTLLYDVRRHAPALVSLL
jgi:predicted regulator of Ras-like GTPase activity (Roadblock/LC7/MglB family)